MCKLSILQMLVIVYVIVPDYFHDFLEELQTTLE